MLIAAAECLCCLVVFLRRILRGRLFGLAADGRALLVVLFCCCCDYPLETATRAVALPLLDCRLAKQRQWPVRLLSLIEIAPSLSSLGRVLLIYSRKPIDVIPRYYDNQ